MYILTVRKVVKSKRDGQKNLNWIKRKKERMKFWAVIERKEVNKMPYKKIDAGKIIEEKANNNPEFAKAYEDVKNEYRIIQQVIKARKEKSLTQKELAEKVGVKQQEISRLENEKHTPTLGNLIRILDGLDLELKIEEKNAAYKNDKEAKKIKQ